MEAGQAIETKQAAGSGANPSKGARAVEIFKKFSRVAQSGVSLVELIGTAVQLDDADRLLCLALYASWLGSTEEPLAGVAWYNVGCIFRDLGELAEAETAFRHAIDRTPSLLNARSMLGQLLLLKGSIPEAQEHFVFIMRAAAPDRLRRYNPAREAEDDETYRNTLPLFGLALETLGIKDRAELAYERHLALGPDVGSAGARLEALVQERLARSPTLVRNRGTRLNRLAIEIAEGEGISRRVMDKYQFKCCILNVRVEKVSLLRLALRGNPLRHPQLLDMMSVIDWVRLRSPMRIDCVELVSDMIAFDRVLIEEVLRQHSADSLVLRCDPRCDESNYSRHHPGLTWYDFLDFLDFAARIRQTHHLDLTLKIELPDAGQADRERWTALLSPRGWIGDFSPPPDAEPDCLCVGVDGIVTEGPCRGLNLVGKFFDPVRIATEATL